MSVGEFIAALALVATVFSASQAWWILPEKVSRVEVENEKQEQRLQKIENVHHLSRRVRLGISGSW